MKLFLCSTLLVATQANFFRHVSKNHRVPHFLGAGSRHATNKFHAVFQIVHDSDLANTAVEYIDCGTKDATTCMSGTPTVIHTVADLSNATVNADTDVTNVKDTTNDVYDLEYTPSAPKNHIITKLELNSHTILEESYLCAAGHVPKSSGAGCDQCVAGKYAERGANSCSNCTAGKESSAGATASGDCNNCAAGKVSAGGVACSGCAVGEKPKSDKSACENCPNGKYQDSAGQSDTCTSCPKGKANAGGAAASDYDSQADCDDCGTGKYADVTGLASCKNCTAGSETQASSTVVTSAAEACVACVAGKVDKDSDSSTTCYSCDAAQQEYQSSTGQTSCNTCSTGTFTCGDNTVSSCASNCGSSGGGGGGITTCANAWQYVFTDPYSGQTSCKTCAAGKDQISSTASSCDDCDAGESRAGSATAACASCDAGKYSDAQAATCTDCDEGQQDTNTDGNKATACEDCPIGKYDDDYAASTACKVCGRGKYQDTPKQTSCTDCTAGSHNDGAGGSNPDTAGDMDASGDCAQCGAGTFSAAGAAECTDCDVGKYSTATGLSGQSQAVCTDCAAGKTTGSAGSGLASDCVFSVTMYGYVKANFTGTCQNECVEWHGQLEDNFNANDVHPLNATGADKALCNLLKKTGEMIKQQGC